MRLHGSDRRARYGADELLRRSSVVPENHILRPGNMKAQADPRTEKHLRPGVDGEDKAYSRAHLPIAQQQTAIGHAVRFVYPDDRRRASRV